MCLDYSCHPDGWYTFPSGEFMKNDLLISKRLALSGNRIYVKAEIPRRLKCAVCLYAEHHDVIKEWNGYVRFDRLAKYDRMDELAAMALAGLHGKAGVVFCGPDGWATGGIVAPGRKTTIPVGASVDAR